MKVPVPGLEPWGYSWIFPVHMAVPQNVIVNAKYCPVDPDAIAEAYLQGALAREEAAAFEEHYLGCPRCSDRLQFTRQFVAAVQRTIRSMSEGLRRSRQMARAARCSAN